MNVQDCIIVGGGPAGLNAAVVLGRCRRKVLIFDTGNYRNRYSHGMHNYLTRDDIDPADFIKICRQELEKYHVQVVKKRVVNSRKNDKNLFLVADEDNKIYYSKKLIIATGLSDTLPPIEGFKDLYGTSIFHCPYCDGWEVRDKKLGVYARNKNGFELAVALKGWSEEVVLFTDGTNKLKPLERDELAANNISIVAKEIAKLEGENGQLQKVLFKNGDHLNCDALFFVNGYSQQCNLAETFDCETNKTGNVITNKHQQTKTTGLYVAGDAAKDMQFVVVAAAEGAKAAVTINKELQKEISTKRLEALQTRVSQTI